jgi:hypothetical protein
MPAGALAPLVRYVVMDDGIVAPGAKAYWFLSGTSTPQPVYTDAALTVPHAHPVVADAEGVLPVMYLAQLSHRLLVTDAAGATIFPAQDDVYSLAEVTATQLANRVYAGPASGAAAAPTFRALVDADLPPINIGTSTELTIASGAITVTRPYHRVDTESDAAADDLTTITAGAGVTEGDLLLLMAENVARVVTVKDQGSLLLNGDFALSATDRQILLKYDGTNWVEIARSVPAGLTAVLSSNDTQVTTAGDPVETLWTYALPAGTLARDGDTVKVWAAGTLAGDTDSKTVNLFWNGTGGTLMASHTQNSNSLVFWELEATITRIASNSQRISGIGHFYQAASHAAEAQRFILTTAAVTDTAAIDIVVQGDGVNSGDIVFEAGRVEICRVQV